MEEFLEEFPTVEIDVNRTLEYSNDTDSKDRYHAAYESSSTTSYRLSNGIISIILTSVLLSLMRSNTM
jgi:hypothetical protein